MNGTEQNIPSVLGRVVYCAKKMCGGNSVVPVICQMKLLAVLSCDIIYCKCIFQRECCYFNTVFG